MHHRPGQQNQKIRQGPSWKWRYEFCIRIVLYEKQDSNSMVLIYEYMTLCTAAMEVNDAEGISILYTAPSLKQK